MTPEQPSTSSVNASGSPVVGARVIVDVLRQLAGKPPETVQLTPMRNKAALFVLEKSLLKMEQQAALLTFPVPLMDLASALHQFARNEKKILYLAQADWGAVKLIDMVFAAVIDQGKLDEEGIWLLNRFRLPLFHAVLGDYSFFFARQNVSRRFINAVTLHLLTTREPFARDLKFVLGGLATRMHEAFEGGSGKFNALCLEGQTWFATQQQRLHKAEVKVRELAENKQRKQQAEERVVALINRCIAGKSLPHLLVDFIVGDWRQLLLWTSMKEGEQGLNWKRQSRLTESMVEFVAGCQTPDGRTQYQKFLPSLIKGLHSSLVDIQENRDRLALLMEPVELVLNAMLMGAMPDFIVHPGLPVAPSRATGFEVTVESNPAMERIRALQAGQWVRFRTQDRQFEACALIVKGEGDQPWTFVNQSGQGVVNKTLSQLAVLLTGGVLEIVGEGNAIDEVLNQMLQRIAAELPRPTAASSARDTHADSGLDPDAGTATSTRTEESHLQENAPATAASAQPDTAAIQSAESHQTKQPAHTFAQPLHPASHKISAAPVESGKTHSTSSTEPLSPELAALDASLHKTETENTLPHTVQQTVQEETYPDEVMQASYTAVDGLQIGARLVWYKSESEDITLKLAVKIRSTGKLVFVNHIGIKSLDTDRDTLARLIASGRVVIIDIGAKFDSALERIVKHIQQDKK